MKLFVQLNQSLRAEALLKFSLKIWKIILLFEKFDLSWSWPDYSKQSLSQGAISLKRGGTVGIPPIFIFDKNWCHFYSTVHSALWYKFEACVRNPPNWGPKNLTREAWSLLGFPLPQVIGEAKWDFNPNWNLAVLARRTKKWYCQRIEDWRLKTDGDYQIQEVQVQIPNSKFQIPGPDSVNRI